MGKILVRRFAIHSTEKPVEMETGKECLAGNTIEVEMFMEIIVHVQFGGNDALAGIPVEVHVRKLPNRFDEIVKHHEADHNFQEGAYQEADERAESGFE